MFIEGNEISRLNKRKVPKDELDKLTLPDVLDFNIFDRTQLLLSKPNKTQRMAAVSSRNLIWLCKHDARKFEQ